MDVNSIVALATEMATQRTVQAAQMAVLKQAIDLQGAGALQLIQALAPAYNNPAHLGRRIDVFA